MTDPPPPPTSSFQPLQSQPVPPQSLPAQPFPSSSTAFETTAPPQHKRKQSGVGNGNGNGNGKRKRPQDGASDSADSTSHPKTRDGPKKKKANRACFHCQKAHLTCDDSRPCQRCVKRGMADKCTEGHRKKAKYLLDEEELEALKRQKSGEGSSKSAETAPIPPAQADPAPPYIPPDPMFSSFSPNSFALGSEAANLEYSILSAILGSSDTASASGTSQQPTPSTSYAPSGSTGIPWASSPDHMRFSSGPRTDPPGNVYASAGPATYEQLAIQPSETLGSTPVGVQTTGQDYMTMPYAPQFTQAQQPGTVPYADQARQAVSQGMQPGRFPTQTSPGMSFMQRGQQGNGAVRAIRSPTISTGGWGPSLSAPTPPGDRTQSVYNSVTKPYDYTEGYHFLMKHLPQRSFEKNDILRIVRALAIFRPSLIALQMPLSEEDEVFVEKCFQRSLVELDKLVSFSGTPTVAWRRTGEICLVGPEFCLLTGWEREELIGKRKYIYELFENQSVVEYWENFANHAFENTTQSVYSHCVLLKPSGAPVPCTFCFSIRRDIMDLPSLVIGQWLPLL
ncbi:hypothetical protein CERSUDRAFT_154783 [Gelatoporia subvermispora B]|uniref:Transcription activator of gluconeogenesis ERT1 n=1 Tax=Ceriporiopsis subvermispora (strain B) TaxID=914234 RepID=M2RGB5_CERS8|nr:hypothetical protein CERSUDRAFT_154783 [Gelatoporia subvermispora B]